MPLVDVLRHNQMDLRGLAALAARMCALLGAPHHADADALELYGISRILRRQPENFPRARVCYERALAAGLPRSVARAARRELAALAKRQRDYARATALWNELVGEDLSAPSAAADGAESVRAGFSPPAGRLKPAPTEETQDIDAYEQLAIYYEHRARDPHRALQLTRAALAAGTRVAQLRPSLEHRAARLERKIAARLL
jgi:hypothetical protein